MRTRLAIALAILLVTACSPRIVEHVRVQRDTTYIERLQVDSLYIRDSVFIREKGDTVYQYRERIRDRYRFIHDTTFIHRTDTVKVENERIVEKQLSRWQSFSITFGRIALIIFALALAAAGVKFYLKWKN